MRAAIVLGNQLLRDHPLLDDDIDQVIMIEAQDLCRKRRYHKHKLVLMLAGMRHYRQYLESKGITVRYKKIDEAAVFSESLAEVIKEHGISHLSWMKASDIGTNEKLSALMEQLGISFTVYANRMFLTSEESLRVWFAKKPNALMESFYRHQRVTMNLLMDGTEPVGGIWNYDSENRQPLPKNSLEIPAIPTIEMDKDLAEVIEQVSLLFSVHPGDATSFWLPVTHADADRWLASFIKQRLENFGRYEDAMAKDQPFLFHSVLSPLINNGLLSVRTVLDAVTDAYHAGTIPIASAEGFVRQLIGWREYMYGRYLAHPDLKTANYFGFTKPLEDWWYTDEYKNQPLPEPLMAALDTVHRYGYNHHIERLMVLGNWFLLNQYNPQSVYEWFSALYVDAYEWVMVPNVLGMSQYADGGRIATKPYIAGGNYLQKMGRWWKSPAEARNSAYTTLYWEFLDANYDALKTNFRMSLVLKQVEKRRGA